MLSNIKDIEDLLEGLRKQREEFAVRLAGAREACEKLDSAIMALEHVRTALCAAGSPTIEAQRHLPDLYNFPAPTNAKTALTPADVVLHAKDALTKKGNTSETSRKRRLCTCW